VAFATAPAATIGYDDTDRPLHDAACAAAGIELDHRVWSDPMVPWEEYDLVVLRATWDYVDHVDGFLAWIDQVGRLGTLHNPASVVAWNLDKRYLLDLAGAGVPVISTRVCTDAAEVAAALAAAEGEVVVKPVVSAGSRRTGRFLPGDRGAVDLADAILGRGTSVLVQPAVASVATDGEVSTLLFGGSVSHSVRKGPLLALGGGLVGGRYTEHVVPEALTASRQSLIERTSEAVARLVTERFGLTDPLLYARVDLVTLDDGTDVVLEVELAEPSFFLGIDPAAADRFAALLAERAGVGRHRSRER
jgi:glutathione synthase/RimK-type ligase-like ATP-grasp enzyme